MRVYKPIYFLAVAFVGFASCKSTATLSVPLATENSVNIVAKNAVLTTEQAHTWGHLDLATDTIPGMSVNKAYEFLKGKKGQTVVVGVVDSGTDLTHEDLVDVAWVNPKEIAGNGIDDDKNGFIDDINGWNFLGPIYKENGESVRILMDPSLVDEATYKKIKEAHDKKVEAARTNNARFSQMLQGVSYADNTISSFLKKKNYTKDEVMEIKTEDPALSQSIAIAKQMYGFGLSSLDQAIKELSNLVKDNEDLLSGAGLKANYRSVLKDNPNTMDVRVYGNPKTGPSVKDEAHGTHVSGIIAASRNNGKGVNGVANNVKIMAIRAVPDGDEYDKDVALAIRYAVDNGAKVINTSFGKGYSPHKEWVWEAIKYAAEKDVLIVNAAGNDGDDIDIVKTFPNDSKDLLTEISDNVITIGAMSSNYDENLAADFSNYGKRNVDIFAPGVQIYSTVPENGYELFNGTSMAAPSTAGVAALIRSYYPKLTASQVKHIIMNSGTKINLEVIKPGSVSQENPNGVKVPFSDLSVTGRIVNAYNALKMSDRMVNGK
uniref:S8 family peptidase n=1 Tax=Polaribacter sp. TaxID=1920175 RepID=UPI0040478A58